jgi:hypothetical protein
MPFFVEFEIPGSELLDNDGAICLALSTTNLGPGAEAESGVELLSAKK